MRRLWDWITGSESKRRLQSELVELRRTYDEMEAHCEATIDDPDTDFRLRVLAINDLYRIRTKRTIYGI